jgi:hypothetical protein
MSKLPRPARTSSPHFCFEVRKLDERLRVIECLNRIIRRYVISPKCHSGIDKLKVAWVPRGADTKCYINCEIEGFRYRFTEADMMRKVLTLGEQGFVLRFRKCPRCDKWLYTRFLHQRFCSKKCRQASSTQTPAYRRKRRSYMRNFRRLERARDERAKERARK